MRKNRDCMTSGRKTLQVISALAAAALVGALGFAAFAMADASDGDSKKAGTEKLQKGSTFLQTFQMVLSVLLTRLSASLLWQMALTLRAGKSLACPI